VDSEFLLLLHTKTEICVMLIGLILKSSKHMKTLEEMMRNIPKLSFPRLILEFDLVNVTSQVELTGPGCRSGLPS
jgi:hypothetical protein